MYMNTMKQGRTTTSPEFLLTSATPEMQRVLDMASGVAKTPTTVLLTGESGTGKEVLARHIHAASMNAKAPFVAVNCGAVPATLMESELFGHEKGAFSGADNRRLGKFEQAHGGTLLLDEISELPFDMQAKLLRVIQEGEVDRLGGTQPIKIQVRIIATTNRDLKEMVRNGQFREDLYYRINVFPLWVPSLRKRMSDLPELAEVLLGRIANRFRMPTPQLTARAIAKLSSWGFPGNISELNNMLERSVILANEGIIEAQHVVLENGRPSSMSQQSAAASAPLTGMTLRELEREAILSTLELCDGNRTHASAQLGISIRTLRNRLREYRQEGFSVPEAMSVKGTPHGFSHNNLEEVAPCL